MDTVIFLSILYRPGSHHCTLLCSHAILSIILRLTCGYAQQKRKRDNSVASSGMGEGGGGPKASLSGRLPEARLFSFLLFYWKFLVRDCALIFPFRERSRW